MPKFDYRIIYKENLFIMKLLTTQKEFLDDVRKIRNKINIPADGFTSKEEGIRWIGKNLEQLPPNIKSLCDKRGLFFNSEFLIKKYQLRYNFLRHVEQYILYNEVDAPKINFDVSLGPDLRGRRSDKWVSIKAYAPLTKEEMREATKKLLELQKEFLSPKAVLDLRPRTDIDLLIKIEQEMEKRCKTVKEYFIGYSKDLQREAIKSKFYRKEFEKWINKHPDEIKKEIEQYSSKDIASMFSKKPNTIRQIYSRIKEKRRLLFGHINQ